MADFIDFPVFDGVAGELWQWISWLEKFFVRKRFTALEKLNLAQSLLAGDADVWFYRNQMILPFQSWEDLKANLWLMFGDFDDSDRIRRRSRTAITPQESISSPATIPEAVTVDKFFISQVTQISGEKSDSKKEVESQVHVSDSESENLRNIETMADNSVLDSFETVVMKATIQKNIRIDVVVVNGDVERIQSLMCITKRVSAHQVLDKMCQLIGLETKKKLKVLKSWMFKYKPERRRSKKQHNQDDQKRKNIQNAEDFYDEADDNSRNGEGEEKKRDFTKLELKPVYENRPLWKKRTFQCLRLQKQAPMSRILYPMRMLHDPGGMKQLLHGDIALQRVMRKDLEEFGKDMVADPVSLQLILDDLKSHLRHKWKSKHLRAVVSVNSLSLEVVTEGNMFRGLSQTSQVWEPGGIVAANVLVDWLVDFNGYDGFVDGIRRLAIDSRRASRVWERGGLDISTFVSFNLQPYSSWCGWLVFDRGKNNKWDAHVDSLISAMLPFYAQDIMKRQADKKRQNVEFFAKFFDPFLVIEFIGMVASKLEDCISLYLPSKLEDKLVFEGASIDTSINRIIGESSKCQLSSMTWQVLKSKLKTLIVEEGLPFD